MGIFLQDRNAVDVGHHGKGKQFHFWIVQKRFLYVDQISRHLRADGFAGGEEKIGHINLVFIVFLGNGLAVLIGKRKIGNNMLVGHILYGCVHQFGIHVRRIVNWKRFFGFQRGIKQGNHDDGKDQQDTKEFSIFMEKGLHKNNLLQKYEKDFCFKARVV